MGSLACSQTLTASAAADHATAAANSSAPSTEAFAEAPQPRSSSKRQRQDNSGGEQDEAIVPWWSRPDTAPWLDTMAPSMVQDMTNLPVQDGTLVYGVKRKNKPGGARREVRVAMPFAVALQLLQRLQLSTTVASGVWTTTLNDHVIGQCEVLGSRYTMAEWVQHWKTQLPTSVVIAGVELHANYTAVCHRYGMRQPSKVGSLEV